MRDTTLANGLEIHVIENHTVPLAALAFIVRGGALMQDSTTEGIANLYAHTPIAGQVLLMRNLITAQGAYSTLSADEFMGHYLTLTSKRYEDGLAWLAQFVEGPDFDTDGLQRGGLFISTQFATLNATPEARLQRVVSQRLWSTAWPRKDILGTPAGLNATTPATLQALHRQYDVPNNAALIVSGDVSTAAVFAAARHQFDSWRRGPDPFATYPVAAIPALDATRVVLLTDAVHDATVVIEWQGPSAGQTPDRTYAADVFTTLFNDPSWHTQLTLVQSGLFQELSMSYSTERHVGLISITGRTTVEALPRALAALRSELAACALPGAVDDNALATSRQTRRVGMALDMESGVLAARQYGAWWGIAGADYYRGYEEHIQTVTAGDVHDYVTTYVQQPYVIGVLGPEAAYATLTLGVGAFAADSATPGAR